MSTYVFFDTETTGVPRDYKAPYTDTGNWPRVVQLSWLVVDENGLELSRHDHIIKPVGFEIPDQAAAIHGISTARALSEGEDLRSVINEFCADVRACGCVVGHNVDFDIKVTQAECCRLGEVQPFTRKVVRDTMKESTDYCNIPGKFGPKWPRLDELHRKLFGCGFEDAHNSLADIEATCKCFWELVRRDVM